MVRASRGRGVGRIGSAALIGVLAVVLAGCSCSPIGSDLGSFEVGETGCSDSEVALIEAAGGGDLERTQQELDEGTDANVVDDEGNSALACAGPAGHADVVGVLLLAGADPNTSARDGDRVAADAIRFCRADVLEMLLEAGADPDVESRGNTLLTQAVALGRPDLVRVLTAHDVGPDTLHRRTFVDLGDQESTSECPPPTDVERDEALLAAVAGKVDPSAVLQIAAWWDRAAVGRAALEAGAYPNAGTIAADLSGITCFMEDPGDDSVAGEPVDAASSEPGDRCPPLLALKRVADPEAALIDSDVIEAEQAGPPLSSPPLLDAAWWGDADLVSALLAAGAEPDRPADGGLTALHAAAARGNEEVVALLLGAGARGAVTIDDPAATVPPKPSVLAKQEGHPDLASLLAAAGA